MSSLITFLLAAGSLITVVLGAPLPRPASISLAKRSSDTYTFYSGTGATPPWPAQSSWVSSFDDMFNFNMPILKGGCAQFNVPANSDQEISDIQSGIQTVASQTGVDARFILAILLQESAGCVRVPTTNGGVVNPGLLQDHDGSASCNIGGTVQNPCPSDTITSMISQGVAGTSSGAGLQQLITQAASTDDSKFYKAARLYNSGSIAPSGDLGQGVATHCYSSDIANRLTGWVTAEKTCTLDGGDTNPGYGSPVSESGASSGSASSAPAASSAASQAPAATQPPASSQAPAPATSQAPATTTAAQQPAQTNNAPAQSSTSASNQPATPSSGSTGGATSGGSSSPTADLAPGVASPCSTYYTVQQDDTCDSVASKFSTTFAILQQLNTALDSTCSNLWMGYAYCVSA